MRRDQLTAILDDGKATQGGGPDFYIIIPAKEMRAVLTNLKHLKVNGTISGYDRRDPPDDDHIDITGYNG